MHAQQLPCLLCVCALTAVAPCCPPFPYPPPPTHTQNAISSAADNQRPKVFVSSSAVGYYGASQTNSFTEDSPAGGDYLAEICKGELWARGTAKAGEAARQPAHSYL